MAVLDSLLAGALEREGAERERWLARETAGDPELAVEVERLLALAGSSDEALLAPVRGFAERAEAPVGGLGPGDTVGAYTLLERLGEGGMGVVFLAARSDGSFERRVALKLLPRWGGDPEEIRAFERERQLLAKLQHPNIAHLLDGGVDPRGLPYLVMEYVDGEPIDRHCDRLRLPLEARIRLVVAVAGAVQAAHRSLVVHRDLKPNNVLVDAKGDVKLLDFGIARGLDLGSLSAERTATWRRAFTPSHASPEQVSGETVTTASDVYQLGLLLYELATGRRPQAGRPGSLADLVELVCRRDAPPASRAVREDGAEGSAVELAARRGATPARLARTLAPELDAVLARALAKDPERRYASPAALADDLGRWLAGRPVEARPVSALARGAKRVRRNPLASAAAVLVAMLTAAYLIAVSVQARAIDRQRQRAEREATTAGAVERFLLDLFSSADPEVALARDITARELLARGLERVDRELAAQPAVQARLWSALGEIQGQLGEVESGRKLVERALARQLELFGEDHRDVAESRQRRGVLLDRQDQSREAVAELERAIALRRALGEVDTEELAKGLAQLGGARRRSGDFAGAERDLRESLEIHRRRGSERGVAIGLNNLSSTLYARGDLDGAESRLREALEIHRRLDGSRNPRVALALYNLASIARRRGRAAEAVPLLEEALATDLALYGDRHANVARDELRLGFALQESGDLARAEALYAAALPRWRATFGEGHLTVAEGRSGLGQLRFRQGRWAEAAPELGAARTLFAAALGEGHYRVGQVELWLGRALAARGLREEALATLRHASSTMRPGLTDETARLIDAELAGLESPARGG